VIQASLLEELADCDQCPKVIIDIAVPRDIERPDSSKFSSTVIDLEDLRNYRKDLMEIRKEDLPQAKSIVEDMVTTFQTWMEGAFDPAAGAMIKEFDSVRQACLEQARASFGTEDQEALEQFSRSLMQHLLNRLLGSDQANS
jgi:glutamyl-tRNA reductase